MNSHPLNQSKRVLERAAQFSSNYFDYISERHVQANDAAKRNLELLSIAMPEVGCDPLETLQLLHDIGSQATAATASGRFHGLVVGGSLPATVGSRVLNAAWDQMATNSDTSPIAIHLEQVTSEWLKEIFEMPATSSVGFVTGTTMGNFICLAAARHRILSKHGWNAEQQGLNGSPAIRIVASAEIHVTVKKVIAMLGLGIQNMELVPCDKNGAMIVEEMPPLDQNTIVLAQAGNVNSGAIDPIEDIAKRSKAAGAWFHLDGAFGLWAAASKSKQHLIKGLSEVDSCVTDGHKWLNTPYDCGIAMCVDAQAMHNAMSTVAPYFSTNSEIPPKDMVPELSRSARVLDVWAALHSLGKDGVESLIDRCCKHATMASKMLQQYGFEVLNEVSLNQVVISHPTQEHRLKELTQRVCESGETWFGITHWQSRDAFRMSFSSWVTRDSDVERSVNSIIDEAKKMGL